MGELHGIAMAHERNSRNESEPPSKASPSSQPPSSRRLRMRDLSRRTSTIKVKPWSQLPGVVAYVVVDGDGQTTDAWGTRESAAMVRAQSFREKVRAGRFDGSHLLEPCIESHLLSVSRSDGWFVHVWLEHISEVAGILAIVGG